MKNIIIIGHIAFLVGMILAILAVFVEIPKIVTWLFILGIIVGFLNISEKESTPFLVAIMALLIASTAVLQVDTAMSVQTIAAQGPRMAQEMLYNLISFISAAAFVVALKQVFVMARTCE
ncbi:MAG: hypothetical protein PHN37_02655 [Candidatus Pacebacteria bacterium]|nr:hypothetical protein [Candidatus Paceibacterota bacterium]